MTVNLADAKVYNYTQFLMMYSILKKICKLNINELLEENMGMFKSILPNLFYPTHFCYHMSGYRDFCISNNKSKKSSILGYFI